MTIRRPTLAAAAALMLINKFERDIEAQRREHTTETPAPLPVHQRERFRNPGSDPLVARRLQLQRNKGKR